MKFKIVVCKLFQFGSVLDLSFWKGLNLEAAMHEGVVFCNNLQTIYTVFVYNIFDVVPIMGFIFDRIENIGRGGEER